MHAVCRTCLGLKHKRVHTHVQMNRCLLSENCCRCQHLCLHAHAEQQNKPRTSLVPPHFDQLCSLCPVVTGFYIAGILVSAHMRDNDSDCCRLQDAAWLCDTLPRVFFMGYAKAAKASIRLMKVGLVCQLLCHVLSQPCSGAWLICTSHWYKLMLTRCRDFSLLWRIVVVCTCSSCRPGAVSNHLRHVHNASQQVFHTHHRISPSGTMRPPLCTLTS